MSTVGRHIQSQALVWAERCVRKRGVVRLQLGGSRGRRAGGRDEAEGLAGDRVGVGVNGGDRGADGKREVGGEVGEGHVVEDDRAEVARALGGAAERGELLLLLKQVEFRTSQEIEHVKRGV